MTVNLPSTALAATSQSDASPNPPAVAAVPIRYIAAPSIPDNPVDRAKSHWLGQLYVRHAKRYPLARALVNRGWLALFPIYRRLQQRLERLGSAEPSLALVAQSVFVDKHGLHKTVLAAPHRVETPAPRAYPARDQHHLKSPHDSYTFPETFVVELPNALVQGGTNIVVAKHCAVHHDLFNRAQDFTSEELHARMCVDVAAGTARWSSMDAAPEHLDAAANFVDACASNYAHWLTEVAPRIALLCVRPEFDGVPIIVNAGLHPNIMESLLTLTTNRHPIITLPPGRAARVSRLYLVSCAGYVPFEPRGGYEVGMSHGKFSRLAFEDMRQACFASLQPRPTPNRIFLRRNSGVRCLVNSDAIESLLVSRGFTVVEPEKLSFAMQVQLFRQAEVIVGATGAALANIIFSESRARIAILIDGHISTIYWYWQNIACASGKHVNYLFGCSGANPDRGIHSDFYVPVEVVREFVDNLL